MLTLTRYVGETITVETPDGFVTIVVKEIRRNQVRIGIDCPREWEILRSELLEDGEAS